MSTTVNASDISTLLRHKAVDVKKWFESGPQKIPDLLVRKCPASAETIEFIPSSKEREPDCARFELTMQSGERFWIVTLEMAFHSMRWVSGETINFPGLMFNVIDQKGNRVPIDYYTLKYTPALKALQPEVWCQAWLQKILKKPVIKIIFAHKIAMEVEVEEDEV